MANIFTSIGNAIASFLSDVSRIETSAEKVITDGEALVKNIKTEVDKIRQFTFNPKWNTRVIQVPSAIEKTKQLILDITDEISASFNSLMSNLKAIKLQATVTSAGEKISGGSSGVTTFLDRMNEINQFITEVDQAILALSGFVDALSKILTELESLDSIFLQQGNSRLYVTEKSRIRVGALHNG